jgi:hypothetical protein
VLLLEAFVVFFATLVAAGLRVAPPAMVWGAGLGLSVLLVLLAGIVARPGGYLLGSIAQGLVVGGGALVPMLFGVGGVFALMWVVALVLGGRIDAERAAWDLAHPDPSP